MNKANRTNAMGWGRSREWKYLGDLALGELIVSDARRDWILQRYPPSDQGRPGLLCVHEPKRRGPRAKKEPDVEPAEIDLQPSWRTGVNEFDGDEDSLPAVEEEVAVAD
jgi:hypothetical protein